MSELPEHPWASSRVHFDMVLLPYLAEHGRQIGQDSDSGNQAAAKVISLYSQLHRSFDPMTATLLQNAIEEYKKP